MNHSSSQPQLFERSIDHKQSIPMSISTAATSSVGHYQANNQPDKKSGASHRGSKSKVFQCTGFGDCRMVFTRSEHLARHMRKHTGEKPFKCIVPGCERMFSRFDNMMQHTQTHNKGRPRRTKTGRSKRGGRKSSNASRRGHSSDEDDYEDDFVSLPSPPPSRKSSLGNIMDEQQQQQIHNRMAASQFEYDDDEDMDNTTSDDEDPSYRPPGFYKSHPHHGHNNHHQRYPQTHPSSIYGQHRTLNPPVGYYPQQNMPPPPPPPAYNNLNSSRFPDSPASSSDSSATVTNLNDYIPAPYRRRSAPQVYYQPYPSDKHQHQSKEALPSIPRRSSVLSQLATYLVNHPDRTPESYLTERHQHEQSQQQQPLPPSPISSSQSMSDNMPTRRLSIHDLSNPIDTLVNDGENELHRCHNNSSSGSGSDDSNGNQSSSSTAVEDDHDLETVQLTEDEYQAIKGFAHFRNSAVICKK